LTLRAAELLGIADVVVYDRLIQREVLTFAKASAECIYVGKPVGRHESRQAEIHELLLRKAGEGKSVVRLKGGDPFVLGRGGEEAEFLAEHGVPFEVVPGISSALAAPSRAGIAVTHREMASSVTIVTGHEASREKSRLDWEALSRMETLVFLMAVRNVGRIAERLIEHGRSPETPAAMIQMAYWAEERVVTATLATIAEDVARSRIQPPATLVVGEVVRMGEKLREAMRGLQRAE
jgi:uroporphyrinogen III methyltransferase/synthase